MSATAFSGPKLRIVNAAKVYNARSGDLLAALTFRDSQASLDCDPTRSLGATADPGTICSSLCPS